MQLLHLQKEKDVKHLESTTMCWIFDGRNREKHTLGNCLSLYICRFGASWWKGKHHKWLIVLRLSPYKTALTHSWTRNTTYSYIESKKNEYFRGKKNVYFISCFHSYQALHFLSHFTLRKTSVINITYLFLLH